MNTKTNLLNHFARSERELQTKNHSHSAIYSRLFASIRGHNFLHQLCTDLVAELV